MHIFLCPESYCLFSANESQRGKLPCGFLANECEHPILCKLPASILSAAAPGVFCNMAVWFCLAHFSTIYSVSGKQPWFITENRRYASNMEVLLLFLSLFFFSKRKMSLTLRRSQTSAYLGALNTYFSMAIETNKAWSMAWIREIT